MRKVLCWLLVCMLALGTCFAETKSQNPIFGEKVSKKYTKTQDKMVNILLLGIDYGYLRTDHISSKGNLNDCHTDAMVLVSINKTQKTVDLVSLPRDTLSYVPGARGIYKVNAAVNCAPDLESGIQKTIQTISRHLGGIEIHHYIAVDVPALIALGDAIGGVEFDLEMSYTGHNGVYQKGLQVLDGKGIMDYMRARKNATVGGTDLGRTQRQRKMVSAILKKLKNEPSLVFDCLKVLKNEKVNIFTDIGFFSALSLGVTALKTDLTTIETHVLDGSLQDFYSNFNFTDQEARKKLLMDVYGIEAEELPYASFKYARWLVNEGFEAIKCINLAQLVLESTNTKKQTDEQKAARKALEEAYEAASLAFDAAAAEQSGTNRDALLSARNKLKAQIEAAAPVLGYTETLRFKVNDPWYEDPLINEYQFNWN